ncbi:hypothetical protein E2C01_045389 [Portunus trituberculatus]|uniref:Uncharacterized protein n=1 Tax=Portunus trituberculatus TaxID=210409 RepID=A0A5B7FVM8_PORTR|nr:hypothetical protein [Portunus trituberculatus]
MCPPTFVVALHPLGITGPIAATAVFLAGSEGTLDAVSGARHTWSASTTSARSNPNDKGTSAPCILNF